MTTYVVELVVDVDDQRRLRRAALVRAIEEGLTANEWRELRRSVCSPSGADLQMLLDRNSVLDGAGAEIIQSNVTGG